MEYQGPQYVEPLTKLTSYQHRLQVKYNGCDDSSHVCFETPERETVKVRCEDCARSFRRYHAHVYTGSVERVICLLCAENCGAC